ncbi:MAG: hypothetical protein WAL72_28565 [Streptosporangiaceae bacterium]
MTVTRLPLDWITGGSRRSPGLLGGQDDADVYGWADGVLVCFEIRCGRMSAGGSAPARPPPPAVTWTSRRPD